MNALLISFAGAIATYAAVRFAWEFGNLEQYVTVAERWLKGLLNDSEVPDSVEVIHL
jgi:hypothetical protein